MVVQKAQPANFFVSGSPRALACSSRRPRRLHRGVRPFIRLSHCWTLLFFAARAPRITREGACAPRTLRDFRYQCGRFPDGSGIFIRVHRCSSVVEIFLWRFLTTDGRAVGQWNGWGILPAELAEGRRRRQEGHRIFCHRGTEGSENGSCAGKGVDREIRESGRWIFNRRERRDCKGLIFCTEAQRAHTISQRYSVYSGDFE